MIYFWPTLQQIAYARVARGIVYTFNIENRTSIYLKPHIIWDKISIEQREEKVSEIMSTFVLPFEVQKQLVGIIMVMHHEINDWFGEHFPILYGNQVDLKQFLTWFSFGVIDRLKTVQKVIEGVRLSLPNFFYLASKYYLEDFVRTFWTGMSTTKKKNVEEYLRKVAKKLWLAINSINTSQDWEKIPHRQDFFSDHCFGMRYYFPKLQSPEMRYQCIYNALSSKKVHHFDLYACLSRINDIELNAVFKRLPQEKLYKVFESFLLWPFQSMFLGLVNSYKDHINESIFSTLLNHIIYNKIRGLQDFPYRKLFECFWNATPLQYKKEVEKNDTLYALVKYVLENPDSFDAKEYANMIEEFD